MAMRTLCDMGRIVLRLPALAGCALVCAPALLAGEAVYDPGSGLAITPPAGYTAQLLTPLPSQYAVISVHDDNLKNAGCLIEFQRKEANSGSTQADLNTRAARPDWIEKVRTEVSVRYAIHSVDSIEEGGVRGAAITGERYQHLPASAAKLRPPTREWIVVMETRKGRTTLECTSLRDEFDKRHPEFREILRNLSLPR
jgi:hypothetical protein